MQVLKQVKRGRSQKTLLEESPAYDPESNGVAEKAVDEVMGQLRALKIGMESRLRAKVNADWLVIQWMVLHACTTINRYQVGTDGCTPLRRLTGKENRQPAVEFGEQVLAKIKRSPKTRKKVSLASKWRMGTWVGATGKSNEHVVILPKGGAAVRVRTVKRRVVEDRWDVEAIKEIVATPSVPNPGNMRQKEIMIESQTIRLDLGGDGSNTPQAEAEEAEKQLRDFKITKSMLEKYGFSGRCPGCEGALSGKRRVHVPHCRKRLEEALMADEGIRTK